MKSGVHSHRQKNLTICRTVSSQTSCGFRLIDFIKQMARYSTEYYHLGLFISFGTKLLGISMIFFIIIHLIW